MSDQKYYIRNEGYVGNALVWWRPNGRGYTTDIREAGKYTYEKAKSICKRDEDSAYLCSYIDENEASKKMIIDVQYVCSKERLFK